MVAELKFLGDDENVRVFFDSIYIIVELVLLGLVLRLLCVKWLLRQSPHRFASLRDFRCNSEFVVFRLWMLQSWSYRTSGTRFP